MSLSEAFIKYKIDTSKKLEFKEIQENICSIYDGIENYIDGVYIENSFNIKSWVLNYLFSGIGNDNLNFIRVHCNELEPYAKNNEILALVRDSNAKNGDKIIIDFKGSIFAVQYFNEFSKVRLVTFSHKEITLDEKDFIANVKVLAIIKGKYFFNL